MPIYEYCCKGCECQFEALMLSARDADPCCPECGAKRVKKVMSTGAIRPKGIPSGSGGFSSPACKPMPGG